LVVFQHIAAALYLAAGVGATLGLALEAPRVLRGARWGLALGAIAQTTTLATLHHLEPSPALTDLVQAIAVMAWLGVIFTLALQSRFRLPGFVPPVAFIAFLAVFATSLTSPAPSVVDEAMGGLPHAHVLLASAGFAALGVASLAGIFFLLEHRALKRRRSLRRRLPMPSLEALDRVNRVALVVGFPLLTLGVVTGSLWLHSQSGVLWSGSVHETWSVTAWIIYLGLSVLRFLGHQGARQAAASAVAGFAFLVFAVVGVGIVQ
jgi:ABC-type transport system involved in cytochrome c biogenesis permease subunit